MSDIPLYKPETLPPELRQHPLFSGQHRVGIMSGEAPLFPPAVQGGHDALKSLLQHQGLKFDETNGRYGSTERSIIVHGPTREQMYHLGKVLGQETVVFSDRGNHELVYTNGPNDGKFHPAHSAIGFHPTQAPPDYYTELPGGKGYFRLHFDFDKLHPAPLRPVQPAQPRQQLATQQDIRTGIAKALRKAMAQAKPAPHPHAYDWHETHTSHHLRSCVAGVLVPESYFHGRLAKDLDSNPHPHTAAHGLPQSVKNEQNEQFAAAGTSKHYGRFAAPFGSIDKSSPSVLKFYPLEGKHQAADAQVAHHGYQTYYAGGKHGKPDLINKNYNTKHLMIYDPESEGNFGEASYTDAWRKTHELAHALTYDQLNQKYGEGRRMGALGKHRTLREAKRAVEWEWMAAHKQRELAGQLGVHISDDDFHRELNTVMHDAVHRAVTGKFSDPQEEGFRPHPHKVPLETSMQLLDEAGAQLGLKHEHDLLQKANNDFVSNESNNLYSDKGYTVSDSIHRKDIRLGLAKALQDALVKHENFIKETSSREANGEAKLNKNAMAGYAPKVPGVVDSAPGMAKDELEEAPGGCPSCNGPRVEPLGSLGNRDHFLCRHCGMSYSTPRQENAAAASDDPMTKEELPRMDSAPEKAAKDAVLPGDKPVKEIDAPGSGGDVSKGKQLKKDAMDIAMGTGKPQAMSRPRLPGMTPSVHPETAASLGALKQIRAQKDAAAKAPTLLDTKTLPGLSSGKLMTPGGREVPFVKKPAADDPGMPGAPSSDANLKEDLKAAGVGFLRNLITKFRGVGNKTWSDLTGAGPASQGRAVRAMGSRMAMGEKDMDKNCGPASKDMDKCGDITSGKDMTKAWRAGGPRPKTGPLAEKPAEKPKTEPVKKAGSGIPAPPKPPAAPKPAKPTMKGEKPANKSKK